VPYGPFTAGDGGTVFLSIQNEREFERFCDLVLGNAALAKDPRFSSGPMRAQNRNAIHEEIHRVFSTLTATAAIERLEKAEIANARLNSMQEFWDHPQLAARGRWREVATPAGPIKAMKPPFNLDAFEPRMDAIPALGAHSRAILAELGFDSREVQQLEHAGITQQGAPA
jgi:itaconate CoA-transferase